MPRTGPRPPPSPASPTSQSPSRSPTGPGAGETSVRLSWRPEHAVGIPEIDAQHQEIFRRAGLFVESLRRRSRQDVGVLLSFLRFYTLTHFGAEEAWMREADYPGLAEHRKQHDKFIREILALSAQHEKKGGQGIDPVAVSDWLERWLTDHVTRTDIDLARHLRRSGVKAPALGEPQDR